MNDTAKNGRSQVSESGLRPLVFPDGIGAANQRELGLAYEAVGFPVHPWYVRRVKGGQKTKASARERGFTFNDADIARTPDQIKAWRRSNTQAGFACSHRTGLIVADVDDPDKFDQWDLARQFPDTVQVSSGREGGYHVYFDFRHLRDTVPADEWPRQADIPGGTLKSAGFVPAPGSHHPNKRLYRVQGERREVARGSLELLRALADYCGTRAKSKAKDGEPSQSLYGGGWQEVLDAEEGHQRGSMFRWAVTAHTRGLSDEEIVDLLWLAVKEGHIESWRPGDPWTRDGIKFNVIPLEWEGAVEARLGEKEIALLHNISNLRMAGGRLRPGPDPDGTEYWFQRKLDQNEADILVIGLDRQPVPDGDSLETFLEEEDQEEQYRIKGMSLTDGSVLIVGPFKAGKTTLRNNCVRSLVDGDEFFGMKSIRITGRAGIIDLEMTEKESRRELAKQKIRNAGQVEIWHLRDKKASFRIMDPQCRVEWADKFNAAGLGHLTLDCLAPALAANDLTESNEDIQKFLVAWDIMLAEAGIKESNMFHHMGHVAERGRGGSALRGWPDVEWKVARPNQKEGMDDPSGPRYFSAYGRGNVNVEEFRIGFDPATHHLSRENGSRIDDGEQHMAESVSDSLACALLRDEYRDRDYLGYTELSNEIRATAGDKPKYIRAAVRLGTVSEKKGGPGKKSEYRLPEPTRRKTSDKK